jgi:xanthine dehydrogenase large subunit
MNKPVEPAMLPAMTPPMPPAAPLQGVYAEVGVARAHESAHLHVAGAAPYTDDLPELAGTLHAALGLSPVAHGVIERVDLAPIRRLPGVMDVWSARDIPGDNDCGALVKDDPILAGEAGATLRYLGQPVFVVVATTREAARRAAAQASQAVQVRVLPPVLTPEAAHAAQQYVVPPMHLQCGDAATAIAAAPHRLRRVFDVGGQEHFYLEGQISYAVPAEDGGMKLYCSTQHPSEMQHLVAHALGRPAHAVQVECRRMGGGFGGKESQSALFVCVAAIAAARLQRPVKLRLDRGDDMQVTGGRHCFHYELEAGYDDAGRILGAQGALVSRAGHSADLSGPVMTRALCHFDNAYWLPHVDLWGYSGRTNTRSNTAFRGFGGPQGAIAIEFLIDSIARALGKDPLEVRRLNFYGKERDNVTPECRNGVVTPYGQPVSDNVIHELVDQLVASSRYAERRAEVAAFNAASPVLKKGLALTPVKFGISFNVVHLNQAGALVHVYTDGSVLVNHGGTEMGQGLNTKVAQVVAHELGLPLARVRCTATDTQKVANTSATAASTGSDINGKAAQAAAAAIRARLAAFAAGRWGAGAVPAEGVRFAHGQVHVGAQALPFAEVALQAYLARVQLWSDGFYATPGLSWDRETMKGRPFFYFAYGAAVSEVIVDTLTGEFKLLAAQLLYDAGRSLNPAVDIGQIEGAFVQGMGWLTTEELVWHPQTGMLTTHAPSTYKIPTANDAPAVFEARLFDAPNRADTIHRSKAVGEPPLLLPFSVFFAIRDAVSAVGGHRVDPPLAAPATGEAILRAVDAVRAGLTGAAVATASPR